MKALVLTLLLAVNLQAESVRIQWNAPNPPPQFPIQSYAVLIYETGTSTCPANPSWIRANWENTNTTGTTYVITRPPGCYMITMSYYMDGTIQGCRSNFITYQLKVGEVAAPPPNSGALPAPINFTIR